MCTCLKEQLPGQIGSGFVVRNLCPECAEPNTDAADLAWQMTTEMVIADELRAIALNNLKEKA